MIASVCATGSVSRCACASERVSERGRESERERERARAFIRYSRRGVQGIAGSVAGSASPYSYLVRYLLPPPPPPGGPALSEERASLNYLTRFPPLIWCTRVSCTANNCGAQERAGGLSPAKQ
jgi:hypothetical protein